MDKKLTPEKESALEQAYKDPMKGLGGAVALYRKVKDEIKNLSFELTGNIPSGERQK